MFKTIIAGAALLAVTSLAIPADAAPMSAAKQYQAMCGNVLNFVPRIVRKEAVAAVGPDAHVVLHSICRGVSMFTTGNAGGLRRTIEANTTLNGALSRHGWRAGDVVGIAIDGAAVQLYVHRQ